MALAIAHESDKSRFILAIVGCGRVAKNIFCRPVEDLFSRPLRILSAHEEIDAACTHGDGVRGRRSKEIDAALACTAVAYAAVDEGIDHCLHMRRWRVRRR